MLQAAQQAVNSCTQLNTDTSSLLHQAICPTSRQCFLLATGISDEPPLLTFHWEQLMDGFSALTSSPPFPEFSEWQMVFVNTVLIICLQAKQNYWGFPKAIIRLYHMYVCLSFSFWCLRECFGITSILWGPTQPSNKTPKHLLYTKSGAIQAKSINALKSCRLCCLSYQKAIV